ncbi:MAG: B12-binding domain-containing radical SAM protein, partial [Bacteroidota bacterium]
IGNKRHLKNELLPALIEWKEEHPGIAFNTQASINLADDVRLMDMMVEARFNAVFVGIETPDETSLVECSKSQNLKRDLIDDVHRIHRAGMQVQGGFIVGFDNDAPTIFSRQVQFIQQSGIVTAMVGMLQALPGTRLFERMQFEERLIDTDSGDNADGTTNFLPRMGLEKLNEGYKEIMRHIYSPGPYYDRVRVFLSEYAARPSNRAIRMEKVVALFRCFFRLGLVGEERRHFWRLLAWTLRHRPASFPLAVTLAVYGYHFRKTSEMHLA